MLHRSLCWIAMCFSLTSGSCNRAEALPPNAVLTVGEARNLPPKALAERLIGTPLGSRVIETARREYPSEGGVPREVDLFSKPELTYPRINGICRTDVVTIEYNWFDHDSVSNTTPLEIAHVVAASRYKAFPMPPDEPGSPENEKAQSQQCANMITASDAFRAPGAGDAQWLAKIEQEYRQVSTKFTFTCSGYQASDCRFARSSLRSLTLNRATKVKSVDCPKQHTNDSVNYCYDLSCQTAFKRDPRSASKRDPLFR